DTWIGGRANRTDRYFTGDLDELYLFDRELGVDQVSVLAGVALDSASCPAARGSRTDLSAASDLDITVYPNPNAGTFTMQWGDSFSGDVLLEVVNTMGQTVYYQEIASHEQSLEVELQNRQPGLYFITLTTETQKIVQRVLVQ
ncbi:MAG TPA: hypothetical protein DCR93_34600, partial [Cytophagales bacterium]|nr:hypothetical protein [Cytophagales bacterium]